MRSNLLDRDFDLLCECSTLYFVLDDGFETNEDENEFQRKKLLLTTRFEDFKDCTEVLDRSNLDFRRKNINRHWGTTMHLHFEIEQKLQRPISHGALLLALDLRGVKLERIENRKDAYTNISG